MLAKMYVHGHQNASEVLASMINLKPLTPPPVHMFLFPNVPICLDVLTTHGNPTSLVFEHYHCAKGEHPGSTKPIDTRNPSVFCGKTPLYSNWLYVGSKKNRKSLPRPTALHCTLLHAAPSLSLFRQETLRRSSEMAGGFSIELS